MLGMGRRRRSPWPFGRRSTRRAAGRAPTEAIAGRARRAVAYDRRERGSRWRRFRESAPNRTAAAGIRAKVTVRKTIVLMAGILLRGVHHGALADPAVSCGTPAASGAASRPRPRRPAARRGGGPPPP